MNGIKKVVNIHDKFILRIGYCQVIELSQGQFFFKYSGKKFPLLLFLQMKIIFLCLLSLIFNLTFHIPLSFKAKKSSKEVYTRLVCSCFQSPIPFKLFAFVSWCLLEVESRCWSFSDKPLQNRLDQTTGYPNQF